MTDDESTSEGFTPLPRRRAPKISVHDEANIREELTRILNRAESVASSDRDEFVDGAASYDVASMVIIRLASLTERSEFTPWAQALTREELAAIRTTRNIAARAAYPKMNDEQFWEAVTVRVPEVIERLLKR